MDPLATNYNPAATVDDGNCLYATEVPPTEEPTQEPTVVPTERPHVDPPVEICGNAYDDDEDGQVDEGCVVAQVTGAEVPNLPWTKVAGMFMAGVGLIGFGLSFKK